MELRVLVTGKVIAWVPLVGSSKTLEASATPLNATTPFGVPYFCTCNDVHVHYMVKWDVDNNYLIQQHDCTVMTLNTCI